MYVNKIIKSKYNLEQKVHFSYDINLNRKLCR